MQTVQSLVNSALLLARKAKVALSPRCGYLKTTLSDGTIVYGRNKRGWGGRGIYLFREGVEKELVFLNRFLEHVRVMVDVGANTGAYTLKAARQLMNRGGIVVAIDPNIEILSTLIRSIRANGFTNVRVRSVALGDHNHVANLYRNFGRPNAFGLSKVDPEAEASSTLVLTLDDLLKWEALDRLDYLKIDAEGSEEQILSGAIGTIECCQPIVQLELDIKKQKRPQALRGFHGFRAPGSHNCLFIPPGNQGLRVVESLAWEVID